MIIIVILILGGVGFAIYWFVLRPKLAEKKSGNDAAKHNTPVPTSTHVETELDDYDDYDTPHSPDEQRVSKPVLVQVNGADVDHSSDSDDTIDEDDEAPPVPTAAKPQLPDMEDTHAPNRSFGNDYDNDYNPKGVPKRAPPSPSPPKPKPPPPESMLSPVESDFMDDDNSGYDDN